MSNTKLVIEERAANIGHFMVGRLLPFRQKRMVGPFIFIDHMGPACMDKHDNLDVAMHPHIGLATLTFLFEGAIMHRDSLGTEIEIEPGAVNWMIAGKGVVHTERTPERFRYSDKMLHGLQIWVAMPKEIEQSEPSFHHIPANKIPEWSMQGANFKLIAGELFGQKSPVPIMSPTYFIEIKTETAQTISIGDSLFGESALYILKGSITSGEHTYNEKQLLVAKDSTLCNFDMDKNTTVYVFGGDSFSEERFIEWNFVASDKAIIEQAKQNWEADRFPHVPNETVRIPLPKRKK
ncbi:MAG: pirin family protein [Aestuariibaculum sp.]